MLNIAQQGAVNSNHNKILCLAGAGTGKTYTMLERIKRQIAEGVDPTSILVLTFTNAAAFNMNQRFESDSRPEFKTFHSFCYSLIVSDAFIRAKLGYIYVPSIATEIQIKNIYRAARTVCDIKLSDTKLHSENLSEIEKFQRDLFYKYVDKQFKAQNLITFDKLCYEVCNLFKYNAKCVDKYKLKYKYIYCDEFQDTDPKQWDFIQSFVGSDIFVVGDALQAIYSFRGATSSIIKSLSIDSDWEVHKLYENYRSTNEICTFANSNTSYADDTYKVNIESTSSGVNPVIDVYDNSTMCYKDKMSKLSEICKTFVTKVEGSSAILCRTNKEVDTIVDIVSHENVNIRTKSKVNVVNILKSVIDEQFLLEWLKSELNTDTLSQYIRDISIDTPEDEFRYFMSKFKNRFNVQQVTDYITDIQDYFNSHNNIDTVNYILDMFHIHYINSFNEISTLSLADIINHIVSQIERIKIDNNDSIYIGTIHSSKGLEYDNVLLIGVNDNQFKLNNEDNCNLYYVGITRAKKYLEVMLNDSESN